MTASYLEFLAGKAQNADRYGFTPNWMPEFLFDFQRVLVDWAIQKGRGAIFADCGMGKTPMQLVWAQNVVRHTNRSVLIVTPLAVGSQTIREAERFGIEAIRSRDGTLPLWPTIVVTNYEQLHHFQAQDFAGAVCDESSILKNYDGQRRAIVQEFLRTLQYRLLCTATAAPNDYIELGTNSEALGELGHMDMLQRFFRNQNQNSTDTKGHWRGFAAPRAYEQKQWRFKHHAEVPFWRWVSSWARALRRPSDFGFDDGQFILPPLTEREYVVESRTQREGFLFDLPAVGLKEQREERRRTIHERCEKAAALVANTGQPAVLWCHLNDEGDRLAELLPDAVQVSGSDSDEAKEERFLAFSSGQARLMIIKPRIGAWGLNWQHCAHLTIFPSHSYEQYYQGVRRCWRFGQKRPVVVEMISTEGDRDVLKNLQRKAAAADRMFTQLVSHMNEAVQLERDGNYPLAVETPQWL